MKHSSKFSVVKNFYDNDYWSIQRVYDAVIKNWITSKEFVEITGKEYEVM